MAGDSRSSTQPVARRISIRRTDRDPESMSDDTLHVWGGTDRWQQQAGADGAVEHSIRKHATCRVEMHWMRSGEGPEFLTSEFGETPNSWKLGRPVDHASPTIGWRTPFSSFRFAIPELSGFRGRAV